MELRHPAWASDGTTHRVSLEFLGFQVDSWPRRPIPTALGLLLLATASWLLRQALAPHRALLSALLGPDPAERRIRTLERTAPRPWTTRRRPCADRTRPARRTQARLVGLAMHLTVIRELIGAEAPPHRLLAVVDAARGNATQAIADLRHLVKGIHPPVLDQGLDTALATLAADSALPVEVAADITDRPSPAVESIAVLLRRRTPRQRHQTQRGEWRRGERDRPGRTAPRLSVRDDGRGER